MDGRILKLANSIVNYSCRVQKGENVLISCVGEKAFPLVRAVVKEVYKAGGRPYVELKDSAVERELLMNITEEQLKLMADIECDKMRRMQAYIGIRGDENSAELSDVPEEKLKMYSVNFTRPVNDIRVPHTKWVVLRYPTNSMAQSANMSLEAFEDYFYNVCNLD